MYEVVNFDFLVLESGQVVSVFELSSSRVFTILSVLSPRVSLFKY
jgi:hypothetical protein